MERGGKVKWFKKQTKKGKKTGEGEWLMISKEKKKVTGGKKGIFFNKLSCLKLNKEPGMEILYFNT